MADPDDKRRQKQAEEMRREAEQKRQDERERLKAERKDDNAAKARRYGEAQGRINHIEREGWGRVSPQPNRGLGSVVYAPQREKYITDDKDFGNF